MRSRLSLFLCVVLLLAIPVYSAQPERCGTKQPGDDEIAAIEEAVAKGRKGKTSAVIDVWVHVISSGPGFGNRPVVEGATLTTARTPLAASSSAETRSRSAWSTIAISSGRRCLTSSFVRRPSRAGPVRSPFTSRPP